MRLIGILVLISFVAGSAAAGGFFLHRYLRPPAPAPVASVPAAVTVELAARPAFALPDTEGRMRRVEEWDGKILVINFWATWCPPCLEEIPVFNELQARFADRGVQFLGIAVDDLENVRQFVAEHGLAYPTLHGQLDAIEIGRLYGNSIGALPYTALVDRAGTIANTHAGPLDREKAEALIEALL
jgi:peroxiredoxin